MTPTEPIVISVNLAVAPASAYTAFTAHFADWWPIATHSLSRDDATRCRFEARVGGVVGELAPDGMRHVWGEVQAVEPDHRIRFSWHPGREPESAQWVEVEFLPAAGGSRVTLTHGGWETLGEIGPLMRQEYLPGWRHVLGVSYAGFAARRD
ncbi:MAG TPA: SRPBCC domain-containing protein [Steroidobacteraceae bacterium]